MQIEQLQNEIQTNDAVMVYFSGENCGVCKVIQPKIKKLFSEEFPKIKQIFIGADTSIQTAAQYNVLTIPTVIVFFDSKEFIRQSRHISLDQIEQQLTRTYNLFFN
jgi:thioredoxin-like negative regulator of GroEL